MGAVKVQGDQVRIPACGQHTGLAPQGFCAVDGGHLEHLRRGQDGGVQVGTLVEHGSQLDLVEQIQIVVAAGPVGAQGHVDPSGHERGHRSNAGTQLQVGGGAVEHRDATFGHQLPVLRLRPHAVSGHAAGAGPHAVSIQHLEGSQTAVTRLALLMLRLGLGHMDVHPQVVLAGVASQVVPQVGGEEGGVFPVNGEVDFNLTVVGAVPLLCQGDGLLTGGKGGRVV